MNHIPTWQERYALIGDASYPIASLRDEEADDLRGAIETLTKERDALAKDAARYQWIAVSKQMPPSGMAVLILERKSVLRAAWIAKRTMSDGEFMGDEDYDEATDTSYWPEGWYEWNQCEEVHWSLDEAPTHWMPLPKPPAIEAAQAEQT